MRRARTSSAAMLNGCAERRASTFTESVRRDRPSGLLTAPDRTSDRRGLALQASGVDAAPLSPDASQRVSALSGACCKLFARGRAYSPLPARSAAAITTTAAESVISSTALGLWTGFVYIHRASVQFRSVQACNRGLGFPAIRHFNKRESARLPRFAICDDVYALHGPVLAECRDQVVLRCLKTEISNKKIGHFLSCSILSCYRILTLLCRLLTRTGDGNRERRRPGGQRHTNSTTSGRRNSSGRFHQCPQLRLKEAFVCFAAILFRERDFHHGCDLPNRVQGKSSFLLVSVLSLAGGQLNRGERRV